MRGWCPLFVPLTNGAVYIAATLGRCESEFVLYFNRGRGVKIVGTGKWITPYQRYPRLGQGFRESDSRQDRTFLPERVYFAVPGARRFGT